jgi:hypothetical protein
MFNYTPSLFTYFAPLSIYRVRHKFCNTWGLGRNSLNIGLRDLEIGCKSGVALEVQNFIQKLSASVATTCKKFSLISKHTLDLCTAPFIASFCCKSPYYDLLSILWFNTSHAWYLSISKLSTKSKKQLLVIRRHFLCSKLFRLPDE